MAMFVMGTISTHRELAPCIGDGQCVTRESDVFYGT